jgi:hypothetical protein
MEGDRATGDPNPREIWVSEDQPMAWHQREGEFDLHFSAEVAVDLAIGMNQAHVQMWAAPLDLIGLSVASSLGLVRTKKISAGCCCFIHPRLVFVASRKGLRRLPVAVGGRLLPPPSRYLSFGEDSQGGPHFITSVSYRKRQLLSAISGSSPGLHDLKSSSQPPNPPSCFRLGMFELLLDSLYFCLFIHR